MLLFMIIKKKNMWANVTKAKFKNQ